MARERDEQSEAVREMGGLVPALVSVLVRGAETVAIAGEYGLRLDNVIRMVTAGIAQPAAKSRIL